MRLLRSLLVLQLFVIASIGTAFGFATNNATITRGFDKTQASIRESITITVNFTNNEVVALQGFYYGDEIPQGLIVNPISVKINGSLISNFIFESGAVGDVSPGNAAYRWVFETPINFSENHPIPAGSSVEIIYSIESPQPGTFHLDGYYWVGYYPGGIRAAFGHSEISDKRAIVFDPFRISLKNGWNLVSMPTLEAGTPVTDLLSSISGKYDRVYIYEGCDAADPWRIYDPAVPPFVNDLQFIERPKGIWIQANLDTVLDVPGSFQSTTSIPLCAGWNLISYTGIQPKSITDALTTISGKYDKIYCYKADDIMDPWKIYDPSAPPYVNDLNKLESGLGYWIHIKEACTLIMNN